MYLFYKLNLALKGFRKPQKFVFGHKLHYCIQLLLPKTKYCTKQMSGFNKTQIKGDVNFMEEF